MGYIQLALEALRLLGQFIGWWIKLDDNRRKEIRDAWSKVLEAEKTKKQSDMRSAINRLNGAL